MQMTPTEKGFEILSWDSDVFGFPVARVSAADHRSDLVNILQDARRNGVRLAYLLTEDDRVARAASDAGGTMVSERVTFVRPLTSADAQRESPPGDAGVVEKWPGTAPTPEFLELAREAGLHSRFRIDPGIPAGVFERIYDAWITNSLNRTIADEVLVTRENSSITGLVTVGEKGGRADIGLLAVGKGARGRGLGRALVEAALSWGVARKCGEAQVVTQRENVAACRLYESCGYRVERGERVFHFWL